MMSDPRSTSVMSLLEVSYRSLDHVIASLNDDHETLAKFLMKSITEDILDIRERLVAIEDQLKLLGYVRGVK